MGVIKVWVEVEVEVKVKVKVEANVKVNVNVSPQSRGPDPSHDGHSPNLRLPCKSRPSPSALSMPTPGDYSLHCIRYPYALLPRDSTQLTKASKRRPASLPVLVELRLLDRIGAPVASDGQRQGKRNVELGGDGVTYWKETILG
jgi:hypothetical protein